MRSLIALLVVFYLSSAAAAVPPEVVYGPEFSTGSSITGSVLRLRHFHSIGCEHLALRHVCDVYTDSWIQKKNAVPYWEIWGNGLRQTAQQMVAILSVMEKGKDSLSAATMANLASKRLRDGEILRWAQETRDKQQKKRETKQLAGLGMVLSGWIFLVFSAYWYGVFVSERYFSKQFPTHI